MEHLVQILVPVHDRNGETVPTAAFDDIRHHLKQHFQSVTAHVRMPAERLGSSEAEPRGEELVVFEIFCERLDRCWWHDFRRHLEPRFGAKLHVRALPVEKL
ncbi:MAG: hypothetical protein IRY96_07025 [Burkholderiales bacterium]|nr:hypothetical protein [Burkholderiales bacterium]PZN00310.1 MAG: hypothetical protein DIU74_11565 [Pseudomonadota bacterium]